MDRLSGLENVMLAPQFRIEYLADSIASPRPVPKFPQTRVIEPDFSSPVELVLCIVNVDKASTLYF